MGATQKVLSKVSVMLFNTASSTVNDIFTTHFCKENTFGRGEQINRKEDILVGTYSFKFYMVNHRPRNVIKPPGAFLGSDLTKKLNFTRQFCSYAAPGTQRLYPDIITDITFMAIEEITNHFHWDKDLHKFIFQRHRLFEAYIA